MLDLVKLRKSEGITRTQFLRKIRPHLRRTSIDEMLLEKIESGQISDPARLDDIATAIQQAFPNYNLGAKLLLTQEKKKLIYMKRVFAVIVALLMCFIVVVGFYYLKDKTWVAELSTVLGLLVTIITLIGLFLGLPWIRKK